MRLNLRTGKICSGLDNVKPEVCAFPVAHADPVLRIPFAAVCAVVFLILSPVFLYGRGPHVLPRVGEEQATAPASGALYKIDTANGHAIELLKVDQQSLGAPVLVDGTLYVTSTGKILYAIDPKTGKTKWQQPAKEALFGIAGGAHVLFAGVGLKLNALEAATGKTLWTFEGDVPITDPVLADGLVVFNTFDGPVAVDQKTGNLRWKLAVQWDYFVFSPLSDRRLCVWKPDEIIIVDTESGKTLWQTAAGRNSTAPGALPSPAVGSGDLVCQLRGSPREAQDWSLHALDAGSGNEMWTTALGEHHTSSARAIISGDTVYTVLDDQIDALALRTGEKHWRAVTKPLESGGAGLLCAGELLIIPQLGGDIAALDRKTGKQKWLCESPRPAASASIRFGGIAPSPGALFVTRNQIVAR